MAENQLQVVTTGRKVRLGSEAPTHRDWGATSIEIRKREGLSASTMLTAQVRYYPSFGNDRLLSGQDCWLLYQRVPEVRAAVNGIALRVSGAPWRVRPTVPARDDRFEELREDSESVRRWLAAPTADGSNTFASLIVRVVIDALVYGVSASELVEDSNGELCEIHPLRGCDVLPATDAHGMVLGYRQDPSFGVVPSGAATLTATSGPSFEPEQIVWFEPFPNTADPRPLPLLEAIFNECLSVLANAHNILMLSDADEIPPGILVMAGVTDKSIERLRQDFEMKAGNDGKIRIAQATSATAMGVDWVQLTRTPKELQTKDLISQVRRTIWRVFGVLPIEMGETDGAPRASTETQVDVSSSHLLDPLLDAIEAMINMRIIPRLIEDPEEAGLVAFTFDRGKRRSETEKQALATALTTMVDKGLLTRNEARSEWSEELPPIEGGDIPSVLLSTGAVLFPVSQIGKPPPTNPGSNQDPEKDPEEDPDSEEDETPGSADPNDDAPGEPETKARRPLRARNSRDLRFHARRRSFQASPLIRKEAPVEWQSPKKFKGYRTLDLRALGVQVETYAADVRGYWTQADQDVVATIRAATSGPKKMDQEARKALDERIGVILDGLIERWSIGTLARYEASAALGSRAASQFARTPQQPVDARARLYHLRAMGFLSVAGGPIAAVRTKITYALNSLQDGTIGRNVQTRADEGYAAAALGALYDLVSWAFGSEGHRIDNWSGKLVELSNSIANEEMAASGTPPVTPEPGSGSNTGDGTGVDIDGSGSGTTTAPEAQTNNRDEWYIEWVRAGGESCDDCIHQASLGIRPLANLSTVPGGAVRCRGNCRCVLVYWTRAEVASGNAVALND